MGHRQIEKPTCVAGVQVFNLHVQLFNLLNKLLKTIKLRSCDEIAGNLLQVWLMKERQDMLTTFLDGLGIKHDGEGSIEEDLPDELDPEKLAGAVDGLCAKFPQEEVAVYLHAFQMQTEDGWAELTQLLESDERLKLG